jgi:hypothetical protein
MPDKMFLIATIHAELHNLKLIFEQYQTLLESAKKSNDRVIASLDKFIESMGSPDLDRNLTEEKPF